MSAHQHLLISSGAFLVGLLLFWIVFGPLILGMCEQILGLNKKKHKL